MKEKYSFRVTNKRYSIKGIIKQTVIYLFGLTCIALGINIAKLSSLGMSAVSSIPRACELIFNITLGTTTMAVYFILVLLQLLVLRKRFKIRNILGILLSVAFGYLVDLTGTDPTAIGHLLINFPRPDGYIMQALYSLLSIFLIGTGVFSYMIPSWVSMPAEGLADAISQVTHKEFGDCKTFVDSSMICIALILQLVFLGGFKSFTGEQVVVREGTVATAILVGQIVKLYNKLLGKKLKNWVNS